MTAAAFLAACGARWPAVLALSAVACSQEVRESSGELRARIAALHEDLECSKAERAADAAALEASFRCREDELLSRIALLEAPARELEQLRAELAREQSGRFEREEEWLRYAKTLSEFAPKSVALDPRLSTQARNAAAQTGSPPSSEPADEPEDLRSAEVHRSLRTLLALEEVRGLDLLESGIANDGWTGPVVFRTLDHDGRLTGGLYAERLRLDGSRAGRMLTIVLENGYESRGGVRREDPGPDPSAKAVFDVRRIALPGVDPMAWVGALPELFGDPLLSGEIDDGLWKPALVRYAVNELFCADAAAGHYRVHDLGGISDGVLRHVHLEQYSPEGALERRIFADRMRIGAADRGVQIELEDGIHVSGGAKAAFLDGRFRIFLPRADVRRWRESGVPGLSDPPGVAQSAGLPGTARESGPGTTGP